METTRIKEAMDLDLALQIRKEVFVKEQGVLLEDEFDEFDILGSLCEHILVFYNNQAAGTGRLRIVDGVGKLERICLLPSFRKFGLGKVIVQFLETMAKEKGVSKVKLHGQTQAKGFYTKLGYKPSSDVFMEDGIPHLLMVKDLSAK